MALLKPLALLISATKKQVGWSGLVILLGCLFQTRSIFRKTHWSLAPAGDAEAAHIKRLALFPALYLRLRDRFGEQIALAKYQRITAEWGLALEKQAFDSYHIANLSGMERFMAFRKRMEQTDADRFNVREYLTQDETHCHYILKRCVAHDFFSEAGTPELTRFFCQGDQLFFAAAFPDLEFTRGDSGENTIAYGKDHCEYLLRARMPA